VPFAPVLDVLFDLDLVLVTGKGGVGKSLVSVALAEAAARVGARPLVVSLGPTAALETLFDAPVGPAPAGVGGGVEAVALTSEQTVPAALARVLGSERLAQIAHRNRALRSFFDAAPGVVELAAWAAIERLVGLREFGLRRYQPVIVDMDASGHAAMMLEVPDLLAPFARTGALARLVEATRARLSAPSTGALLVATPAPLVVEETLDLYDELVGARDLLVAAVVLNRVPGPPLPGLGPAQLAALAPALLAAAPDLAADLSFAHREQARYRAVVEAACGLARSVDAPVACVPEIPMPAGRAALLAAGRALGEFPRLDREEATA